MINDFCAGGLVFYKQKLLILQRYNGVWLFPKGHIDPGETPEIAALREVREESGIEAEIIQKIGQTSYRYVENGEEHFKTVDWFLMKAFSDIVKLEPGFFIDSRWVDERDLVLLSFEHDRKLARDGFKISNH